MSVKQGSTPTGWAQNRACALFYNPESNQLTAECIFVICWKVLRGRNGLLRRQHSSMIAASYGHGGQQGPCPKFPRSKSGLECKSASSSAECILWRGGLRKGRHSSAYESQPQNVGLQGGRLEQPSQHTVYVTMWSLLGCRPLPPSVSHHSIAHANAGGSCVVAARLQALAQLTMVRMLYARQHDFIHHHHVPIW